MTQRPRTAFITGGASGIARALTQHLISKDYHVFIADQNLSAAAQFAQETNAALPSPVLHYTQCDVSSWSSQLIAFQTAIKALGGKIDFVAPIAGIAERKWIPFPDECMAMQAHEFAEPDLSVVDVDLKGVLFTIALAMQHFRRQEKDAQGFRGKIGCVASICGIYAVPTLPVYTGAKHGVVGFTRTYGKLLPGEGVTLNSVCPNVTRTGISTSVFYDKAEREGLLVPMEGIVAAFEDMLHGEGREGSGILYECGPKGGFAKREDGWDVLDKESERSLDLVLERARPLHYPV